MKQKPAVSKRGNALSATRSVLGAVGRAVATLMMVGIITGCIVASILTVYVLKYIGAESAIDLDAYKLGYTSIVYATDSETGIPYELQRLYFGGENRIWVDFEDINQYTRDAIVAVEDKRFWEHDGVDWKRTLGAGIGLFMPISGTTSGGGSTITQQLIKNITNDDDIRIERKVREIFRALNLSQRYSRDEILEAYLNVVPLGNGTNGIQAAANVYFQKDAKDLTLAESAAIVGITKYPGYYDPFNNPDNNKERQEWILKEMLEQGKITRAEYDAAVKEKLDFKRGEYMAARTSVQSYFVDHLIEEVIADLMEQKGYTKAYATEQLYQGGYRIYATVDQKIQTHLEELYKNTDAFPAVYNEEYPQSCSVITDTGGKILGIVGGIGDKDADRVLNRATMSQRHPGSSIKPLAAYSLSFELDRITWSTVIEDSPITLEEPGKAPRLYPTNYYGRYDGMMTVETAIMRSVNTIPVKLVQQITPQRVFEFLEDRFNFHSLVSPTDVNLSSMALGGMTYGVTPLEMAGAYQAFANGGWYTAPYSYTKVEDANGRTILEKDLTPRRAISEETAVIMNKLLQRVTAAGTGTDARLPNMPTGGKTGTSSDDVDQWFIGFTPYYVCQVWLGYDEPRVKRVDANGREYWVTNTIRYGPYPPPIMFKTIMEPLHEGLEYKQFPESENVVSMSYCTASGGLATEFCPGRASGWYKKSRPPGNCTMHSAASLEVPDDENDGGSTSSSSSRPPSIFDALRDDTEAG